MHLDSTEQDLTSPSSDGLPTTEPGRVERAPALNDVAMAWVGRGLWSVCVAVYLIVFVGGIQAGNEELGVVARAAGFTLVAAVLGRMGLNLLGRARVPGEKVPMADEDGQLGSRIDIDSKPNVAAQEDQAEAA
jgi:hypothetical protein